MAESQYDIPQDYVLTKQEMLASQASSVSFASAAGSSAGQVPVYNGSQFDAGTILSGSGITIAVTYAPTFGLQLGINAGTLKSSLGIMSGIWKLGATGAPTVNDDSSLGYSQGSLWFDGTTPSIYGCTSAALGAAVWLKLSP